MRIPRHWVPLFALLLVDCQVSRGVKVEPMSPTTLVTVKSPVKVHLKDGSTVVFREGVIVDSRFIRGGGLRYGLDLAEAEPVAAIPVADVAAMESFRTDVDVAGTVASSLLTTAVGVVAAAALAVAVFGSCPTVYSDTAAAPRLEAETFSYSIVPLFEVRDLDRLSADVGPDGSLRLEVRNEALETHYINHLQVLEVRHAPGADVLPDATARPRLIGPRRAANSGVSRAGRSVLDVLAASDGRAYETDVQTLAAARSGDLEDWIDLVVPASELSAAPAGELLLALRARSSLLNTVLFYDVMLAEAGALGADWLNLELGRISNAVELARFCRRYMGLRVAVWREGAYREVARIPDPGPIAWHDVVVPVPVSERELRIRLSFLADAWRIDSAAVGAPAGEAAPRVLPVVELSGPQGLPPERGLASLQAPDERYLQTSPGQRFAVRFAPEALEPGERRTFLLSSQGYYTEWIRGDWVRRATTPRLFAPSEATMLRALEIWKQRRATFEARFEAQRVPVR